MTMVKSKIVKLSSRRLRVHTCGSRMLDQHLRHSMNPSKNNLSMNPGDVNVFSQFIDVDCDGLTIYSLVNLEQHMVCMQLPETRAIG